MKNGEMIVVETRSVQYESLFWSLGQCHVVVNNDGIKLYPIQWHDARDERFLFDYSSFPSESPEVFLYFMQPNFQDEAKKSQRKKANPTNTHVAELPQRPFAVADLIPRVSSPILDRLSPRVVNPQRALPLQKQALPTRAA